MARSIHKLTDVKISSRKLPSGRHSDGGGLYLNVKPTGSKSWLFMWTQGGKRKEMGLGPYPAVSLAAARKQAMQNREAVANGRDPLQEKRASEEPTFSECSRMFLESMEHQWRNEKHRAQWRMTLGVYCKPLAKMRVSEIGTEDVLGVLSPIWKSKNETASRLRGRIERVLDYARARGWRTGENPSLWRGHLKSILPGRQKLQRGHHPAMPYEDVPAFYARLVEQDGFAARALRLVILTSTRSGEALGATWDEFDLDAALWVLPPERTKSGRVHRVPLSLPAMRLLEAMLAVQSSKFVFPGQRAGRPLSDMSMTMVMRRLQVSAYTVHGFRSSMRDWAGDETNFPSETAEAALAHAVGDATERAYRRGDGLEKRRTLMEAWGEFVAEAPESKVVST